MWVVLRIGQPLLFIPLNDDDPPLNILFNFFVNFLYMAKQREPGQLIIDKIE